MRVGCCGFGMAQKTYVNTFPTVEVQNTFYEPPQLKTLERWKSAAPTNFEFAIKAWQLITHTAKSPTFRRLKSELSESDAAGCGSFQDSEIIKKAWARTLACAETLKAERILFQCPASFKPTDQNVEQLRVFFQRNNSHKQLKLFWEPRGDFWSPELIKQLCEELKIFHAVDPFVHKSVTPKEIYYRLHGKSNWRYNYDSSDLDQLAKKLPAKSEARVFFNNATMVDNARSFQQLIQKMEK